MANEAVSIEISNYRRVRADLLGTPKQVDVATRRAINKTLRTGRTRTVTRIREDVKVKSAVLKSRLKITRATSNILTGVITPLGKGIPLIEFAARKTNRGVTFSAKKGKRELLRAAFIATTSRGEHVFQRKADPSRPSGHVARLPIYLKYGPSMHELFNSILDELSNELLAVFGVNFERELRFELSRNAR